MKRCPECRRDYYDDTLLYCLDDGNALLEGPAALDEPATAILSEPRAAATGSPSSEALTRAQIYPTDKPAALRSGKEEELQKSLNYSAEKPGFSSHRAAKPLIGLGLTVLILAGGFFSYRYFGSSGRQIESIAVMPFVNESGNADVEYLSDGMTETLINSLSQIPDLNIKARSSVFRYKGRHTEAATVGEELSVQAILNGRVVQRGDGLTISLELVDAQTGNQIWGDKYERKQADLALLQNQIARDVISKLKTKLSRADEQKLAKNYTGNSQAYQLYLQGRYFWNKQTIKDIDRSIEYFQRAISIDPNYALAYAGLADAYSLNAPGSNRERMAKAREAALKAISLDDGLAEAHASLGRPLSVDDYDFAGAEREFRRAIDLNPNYGIGHHFLGDLLASIGRFEEAFAAHQRALELEPFSAVFNTAYGNSLVRARRYGEAITRYNKALELDPNFVSAYGRFATVYEITGKYAECVELRAKVLEQNDDLQSAARMRESFAKGGWEGFNRYIVGEHRPPNRSSYQLAVAFTALGEKDTAVEALYKSYEDHEISLVQFLHSDPRLDPLRNDPRFQELLKKVGFPG